MLRAVAVLLLLLPTHPSLAGEEREIAWREAFVTVDASLEPIEGHDGHAVGLMRQRGFAFYDDGDLATVNAWITFERSGDVGGRQANGFAELGILKASRISHGCDRIAVGGWQGTQQGCGCADEPAPPPGAYPPLLNR